MRTRIRNYMITIDGDVVSIHITLPKNRRISDVQESIRLIIDETAQLKFCSSFDKNDIQSIQESNQPDYDVAVSFIIPEDATVAATDQFTIELDWGTTAEELKQSVDAIIESLAVRKSVGIVVENVVFVTANEGRHAAQAIIEDELGELYN